MIIFKHYQQFDVSLSTMNQRYVWSENKFQPTNLFLNKLPEKVILTNCSCKYSEFLPFLRLFHTFFALKVLSKYN